MSLLLIAARASNSVANRYDRRLAGESEPYFATKS
jgi:hypothetical protein